MSTIQDFNSETEDHHLDRSEINISIPSQALLAADSSSSSPNVVVVCLFVCLFGSQVEKCLLIAC